MQRWTTSGFMLSLFCIRTCFCTSEQRNRKFISPAGITSRNCRWCLFIDRKSRKRVMETKVPDDGQDIYGIYLNNKFRIKIHKRETLSSAFISNNFRTYHFLENYNARIALGRFLSIFYRIHRET